MVTTCALLLDLLLSPLCYAAGKIIASTVAENTELLEQLLGVKPCVFKPCLPNLVSSVSDELPRLPCIGRWLARLVICLLVVVSDC